MNETIGGNLPPGHNALLVPIQVQLHGTGSFICPVAQTRLDIRPLFTQSWTTGEDAKGYCFNGEKHDFAGQSLPMSCYRSNGDHGAQQLLFMDVSPKMPQFGTTHKFTLAQVLPLNE